MMPLPPTAPLKNNSEIITDAGALLLVERNRRLKNKLGFCPAYLYLMHSMVRSSNCSAPPTNCFTALVIFYIQRASNSSYPEVYLLLSFRYRPYPGMR